MICVINQFENVYSVIMHTVHYMSFEIGSVDFYFSFFSDSKSENTKIVIDVNSEHTIIPISCVEVISMINLCVISKPITFSIRIKFLNQDLYTFWVNSIIPLIVSNAADSSECVSEWCIGRNESETNREGKKLYKWIRNERNSMHHTLHSIYAWVEKVEWIWC